MGQTVEQTVNPLLQLLRYGQSPWYDYIRRGLLTSGELHRLITHDGLTGVTSNPSIFEKAIAGSTDYHHSLTQLAQELTNAKQCYEALAIRDVQDAADLLYSVYETSSARDGYVSLEVDPELAFNTAGAIEEALRLYHAVGRKNVMIKVPATPEGIAAVEALISQGINVNVTLLFSVEVYEQVAWAYIRGLAARAERGGHLQNVASVASFFVSRIDTVIDQLLEAQIRTAPDSVKKVAQTLIGKIAIANAKLAYRSFQHICASPQFLAVKAKGAQVQRLLWASTGTKNPRYPDTYYVEELIGPDTVNTIPAATFTAFRDHGKVRPSLMEGLTEAQDLLDRLPHCGIDLSSVTQKLLVDGTVLFRDAFTQLITAISQRRTELLGAKLDTSTFSIGARQPRVTTTLQELHQSGLLRRLWAKDPTLWSREPEHQAIIQNALGWLHVIEQQVHQLDQIHACVTSVRKAGFTHALLLGMGGSSLCPEVFRLIFGVLPGYPELLVLDSTIPTQIRAIEARINLDRTLFLVSSKSGSTIEPLMLFRYFYDRVQQRKGERAGQQFIAITDPGSPLETLAQGCHFRHIFPGVPDIGGRYSALSNFGIVPGAIMGVNVGHLLGRAERMRHSCDACIFPQENPGVALGVALAELAQDGRDKLTLLTSPSLHPLGAWIEQLLAESTGKDGKGLIPIHDEPLGTPKQYGHDRMFVYLHHRGDLVPSDPTTALVAAGYPVIRIDVPDLLNVGEEFFRWEMATAVAGALLELNAFDQPNVQESKDNTSFLLEAYQQNGSLPADEPSLTQEGLQLYVDPVNAQDLNQGSIKQVLSGHLARIRPGDYVAINAYLPHTDLLHHALQDIRTRIRDRYRVATTLGYGPRFLHSTGQLHKGGPNTGVFFHLTADDDEDLKIPGEPYTFGVLKTAQAQGDFRCLTTHRRRIVRIHLGRDILGGLQRIAKCL